MKRELWMRASTGSWWRYYILTREDAGGNKLEWHSIENLWVRGRPHKACWRRVYALLLNKLCHFAWVQQGLLFKTRATIPRDFPRHLAWALNTLHASLRDSDDLWPHCDFCHGPRGPGPTGVVWAAPNAGISETVGSSSPYWFMTV